MDIIQKTRELGSLLQETEEYQSFMNAKQVYENDAELESLIGELNLVKLSLESAMQKGEPNSDDIKSKNEKMQSIYQKILANANMIEYQRASQNINSIIQQIHSILNAAANGEDPYSFDPNQQCTGSCESCSGCHE